jgi:predicted transport protein
MAEMKKTEEKVSLKDLDIRFSELRDEELAARPVTHVGH